MISRPIFGKLALGSMPLAAAGAKIDSTVHGVRIGVGATEVWFRHIEPKISREEPRARRLSVPLDQFRDGIRGQRGKVPWGTGDVPIREVLQLLKREKYPIVADIEYDYGGAADPWNELKKCFAYCKSALEEARERKPRCTIECLFSRLSR